MLLLSQYNGRYVQQQNVTGFNDKVNRRLTAITLYNEKPPNNRHLVFASLAYFSMLTMGKAWYSKENLQKKLVQDFLHVRLPFLMPSQQCQSNKGKFLIMRKQKQKCGTILCLRLSTK